MRTEQNKTAESPEEDGKYPRDRIIAIILAILVAVPLFSLVIEDMAVGDESSVYMELIDNDGNVISSPLFKGSVDFDTITTESGIEYIIQAGVKMDCIPAYLIIHSPSGEFNVTVKMTKLAGTWMDNFGIRMYLDDDYAELKSSNSYSTKFMDDGAPAIILPEHKYKISLEAMDGDHTKIAPESITDITVIYTFEGANKTHLVAFIDEDEVVCVKALIEGEPCGDLPVLTKEDLKFEGWYDNNGRKITSDTIFDFTDDTTFTAKWGTSTTWIIWWLILILLALSLYIIWTYVREDKRRFE